MNYSFWSANITGMPELNMFTKPADKYAMWLKLQVETGHRTINATNNVRALDFLSLTDSPPIVLMIFSSLYSYHLYKFNIIMRSTGVGSF